MKVPQGVHKTICEPEAKKLAPQNDYDAKFSVQFLVAAALIRGRLTFAELEPDALGDEAILALTRRVKFADDPDSPFPLAYSGEVLIKTHDGREFLHREHINRGAANRPLTNDEIVAKWQDNAAMAFGPDRVRDLQAAVLGLDEAAFGAGRVRPLRDGLSRTIGRLACLRAQRRGTREARLFG